tara:strand:+ start:459 stop:701 length:243 start_codon:yes stop_codon:yes gene_type:complete
MGLSVSNKIAEKYFKFLNLLDNSSKKMIIKKLNDSLNEPTEKTFNLNEVFGKWEDDKTADEIIKEIRDSRVNKKLNLDME